MSDINQCKVHFVSSSGIVVADITGNKHLCSGDKKSSKRLDSAAGANCDTTHRDLRRSDHSDRFKTQGSFDIHGTENPNRFGRAILLCDQFRSCFRRNYVAAVSSASSMDTFFRPMRDTRMSLRPSATLSRFVCAENTDRFISDGQADNMPDGGAHIYRFNWAKEKRMMCDQHIGRFLMALLITSREGSRATMTFFTVQSMEPT